MKKNKIRTAAESAAALNVAEGPDLVALVRRGEDLEVELHAFGNALHKAKLHRQGTAADTAAGMIETIVEELQMAVDYEKLGELIDGYWGVATADVAALPTSDVRDDEIALLRDENEILRSTIIRSDAENVQLREALAHVEVVLTILRGAVCYTGGDQDELQSGVTA